MKNSTVSLDVDAAQSAIRRLTSHLESGGVLSSANSLTQVKGPKTGATSDFTERIEFASKSLIRMVGSIRAMLEESRSAIEGAIADLDNANLLSDDDAQQLRSALDQIASPTHSEISTIPSQSEPRISNTSVFN